MKPLTLLSSGFFAVAILFGFLSTAESVIAELELGENQGPVPVIVELFTSEGCSSCPPADNLLNRLQAEQPVEGARIIALGLHVDYWNRLGWEDPFSSAEFSHRQRRYGLALGTGIYTPMMVVNGTAQFVGSDRNRALDEIAKAADSPQGSMSIELERPSDLRSVTVQIRVTRLPVTGADSDAKLLLAVTEEGLFSRVTRGENAGRVLRHAATVRRLKTIGNLPRPFRASEVRHVLELEEDWKPDALRMVAFVQERSGRVLATASSPKLQAER